LSREREVPVVILRVAGIYGPGRGHYLQQYLRNEARIPGQGLRFINMIHRDDVVRAIVAALQNGRPGEIYNAVDDEPVALVHFFRWLSETLGKWMPPFVEENADEQRKRGLTNKKVQNRRLKMELGCQLKYPTFRQGYSAEIQRLDQAGELNIELEPR
jgi:nucleoside-diphosphate-sugar epimerase